MTSRGIDGNVGELTPEGNPDEATAHAPEVDYSALYAEAQNEGQAEVTNLAERKELVANNINERVMQVQQQAGWDVGPEWYDRYVTQVVGNSATEKQMFDAFMSAFNLHFPLASDGSRHADQEARALGAVALGSESPQQSTQSSAEAKIIAFPQRAEPPEEFVKNHRAA